MKRLLHVLQSDWEKAILGSVVVVGLCFALSALHAPETDGRHARSGAAHRRPSLLGPDAWAFLGTPRRTPPAQSLDDLFRFSFRQPTTAPEPPPEVEADGKIPVEGKLPEDKSTTVSEGPPPLPPPGGEARLPVERELRTMRYIGVYVGTTGQRLAAVEIRDPKTGQARTGFWHAGPVGDGIRVQAFDGNTLRFLAPDGNSATVARGAEASIQLRSLRPRPDEHRPER